MKKILVIANLFLGSTRMQGLIKYLPEFGWEPVLLTPKTPPGRQFPPGLRVIATQSRDALHFWKRFFHINPNEDFRSGVKKRVGVKSKNTIMDSLLTFAGAIVNYPDSEKGWRPFAIEAGERLLQHEKFDAIISSSSPVTAHIVASGLKKTSKLPWLADLRDPWSQNHNYSYGSIRRWFDKRLELKTLAAADNLLTVSRPWANNLSALHKGKTTHAITNGFDPELLNRSATPLTQKMTITYTGLIYQGKQRPEQLLEAIAGLITGKVIDPTKIEIRFYGAAGDFLNPEIERFHLQGIAVCYGDVSRDVSIQKQRESHILLLLNWDDPEEKGTIPGKVFEYMATSRPILAIGGSTDDAVQQILQETEAGYHASSLTDIKSYVKARYSEYISTGGVASTGNKDAISRYSQREMARKFSDILEQITSRR